MVCGSVSVLERGIGMGGGGGEERVTSVVVVIAMARLLQVEHDVWKCQCLKLDRDEEEGKRTRW